MPTERYEISLVNTLDFDRTDCPVVIRRDQMPEPNVHELWITVVDPSLPPRPEPSKEVLAKFGTHQIRKETNGYAIFHQLDDLDKDGIWDELFFMTDIKANATKKMYIYIGHNMRGWNKHATHAELGSYCRHIVPFWESAHVGWKLWYPTDCDVYGKRVGQLISQKLCIDNLDGYGVPFDMGSDIMSVSNSFGGGGICLFEDPADPLAVSRPRFSPEAKRTGKKNFNAGQMNDTRYAFDVVVNGPMRSMVRVKTMNWNTGRGEYELEQLYTAYANQNYSTCKVLFSRFSPEHRDVRFGCGIRKKPDEQHMFQQKNIVITSGPEEIKNPDDIEGLQKLKVDFIGTAMVVKDEYNAEYCFVPAYQGNHVFKFPLRKDRQYEYMIAAAWSEGEVLKTHEAFKAYVLKKAAEYDHPIKVTFSKTEEKGQ